MTPQLRQSIIALMKREITPAIGCTEPAAVALAVARATELLGILPEKISLYLSGNIIKNAMGVGIPGTGMIGLPVAVALGALVGKSEYGLEVLRDVNPDAVKEAKSYIAAGKISVNLKADAPSILYIEVTAEGEGHCATAVIRDTHTTFTFLAKDGETIVDARSECGIEASVADPELDMATVYEFATTAPLGEIRFIHEAGIMNRDAARLGLREDCGHGLGKVIRNQGISLFGDTPVRHMLSMTSAACDARMGGAVVPVMSNSGSGNQGITATLPVMCYAEDSGATEENLIRALALSGLTSIYIKQSLGRLSALCGCVVASTGSSAGLVHLMGGGYDEVCMAVKNMVANLTGMICDGAKPACAMKITSGVSTALMSAMLAVNGKCVTSQEGIVDDDIDVTIHNLTSVGRDAMKATDRCVLDIMVSKPTNG